MNNTVNLDEMKSNIMKLLDDKTFSNYRISKETGVPQTTLSRFARRESEIGNMSLENAIKLNKFYLQKVLKKG